MGHHAIIICHRGKSVRVPCSCWQSQYKQRPYTELGEKSVTSITVFAVYSYIIRHASSTLWDTAYIKALCVRATSLSPCALPTSSLVHMVYRHSRHILHSLRLGAGYHPLFLIDTLKTVKLFYNRGRQADVFRVIKTPTSVRRVAETVKHRKTHTL